MRILAIIALSAMTFGFASCAHKATTAPSSGGSGDGKSTHHMGHSSGYKK